MKAESGDDPNHTFPLRDVESSFKVELKQGPEHRDLGSLSYGQVMREAYPGALYYYITHPYRVTNIFVNTKSVLVRRDRRYTTRPQTLPTQVFPNLSAGSVYRAVRHGDLIAAECGVQVREAVIGFKERRGPNEFLSSYPLDFMKTSVSFKLPRFTRNYFTSGVVLTHPALSAENVKGDKLASLLYEAFLMLVPFERQDISSTADRHRTRQGAIAEGSAFLAIFDQTYGSLRLSGRLLEGATLREVCARALELCDQQPDVLPTPETLVAMRALAASACEPAVALSFAADTTTSALPGAGVRVILPGSKGLDVNRHNEEFMVEGVFFRPDMGGLAYKGHRASNLDPAAKDYVAIAAVVEIPGESAMGVYSYETGEIEPEE